MLLTTRAVAERICCSCSVGLSARAAGSKDKRKAAQHTNDSGCECWSVDDWQGAEGRGKQHHERDPKDDHERDVSTEHQHCHAIKNEVLVK